ncbi:hypothetical protein IPP75_00190 [Candidatus Saccharibacteria bacterium]|nr:MAG: hypothetical protein IPP75_00190 [Candidatus Saccharibacteria bacterium]
MQKTTILMKRFSFALAAFGFMGVFALAATQPASARQGEDDTTVAQESTEQEDTAGPEAQSGLADDSNRREEVKLRVNQLREDAKKDLEKKRDGRKEMADEKRKLVCKNKQKAIENKLAAFNQAADKHLAKLDDVYKRIQAYKAAENLQPANYDDLVAAATAKQEAATAAVAALKELAVGVDCSDPETVVKLSEVREAAKATRTALHDYRKALKDIVVALAQSKDDAENGDETTSDSGIDSTSDTTEGTN